MPAAAFKDEYPKLASFLLYFYDPPNFDLTGDRERDIVTLDGLESAAVAEYLSEAGYTREVLNEGRRLLGAGSPPWDEIDRYVSARPVDFRDEKTSNGVRNWIERVLARLESSAP